MNKNEIAVNVIKAIISMSPQINKNGAINYYFCGSLVSSAMSMVKGYTRLDVQLDGSFRLVNDILLSEEARKEFSNFNRTIGDIDVALVNSSPYKVAKDNGNKTPSTPNIKDMVPEAIELFPPWKYLNGDPFDKLGDQEIKTHNVAILVLEDGTTILTVNPLYMLTNKITELDYLSLNKSREEILTRKNQQRLTDINILYRAIKLIYTQSEISEALEVERESKGLTSPDNLNIDEFHIMGS